MSDFRPKMSRRFLLQQRQSVYVMSVCLQQWLVILFTLHQLLPLSLTHTHTHTHTHRPAAIQQMSADSV